MQQPAEKRLFGVGEGADRLGVSRESLRRLMQAGKLRTVRICRRVLIPAAEIDRLAKEGTSSAKAQHAQKLSAHA